MNRKRIGRRTVRLAALLALFAGYVLVLPMEASANHSAVKGEGEGQINGSLSGGSQYPGLPLPPCATYSGPLVYTSVPDRYVATYTTVSETAPSGLGDTFVGKVTVTYRVDEATDQNPEGSFSPGTRCGTIGTPEAPGQRTFTAVSGTVVGNAADDTHTLDGADSVLCEFNQGSYRRIGTTVEVELRGDAGSYGCSFNQGSKFTAHQKHVNEQTFGPPTPPSNTTGAETFETCLPSACLWTNNP